MADDGGTTGSAAADVAAPRPIAPISVSFATSRRPAFRWAVADGSDGARVEVCADRACTRVVAAFDGAGDHASPPVDLPSGVVFWRLRGTARGAAGDAASVVWEFVVPARSAAIATSWGAMFDANGDGFGDVAAADSDAFTPTQDVFVYPGGPAGPAPAPSAVLSAPAPVVGFASSIASAADIDGDGFADLVVGSPRNDTVYVYRGGPAGLASSPAVLQGAPSSGFGAALAGAGDVDGDGYGDVVVGMPHRAAQGQQATGGATLLFGGPGGVSLGRATDLAASAGSRATAFGAYVSSAGDADGDGLADVAVWSGIPPNGPEEIALYLGRDRPRAAQRSLPSSARLKYDGSSVDWLGNAKLLACAGDVNGDGYTDFAVATSTPPNMGFAGDHVSLFLGGPSALPVVPSRRWGNPLGNSGAFALSLASLDFDGDGLDDVAVSAGAYDAHGFSAIVFDGDPSGVGAALGVPTAEAISQFEREVGSAGDIDGDGFADLLIAFPSRITHTTAGDLHGAVEVHAGGAQGPSRDARWTLLPPDAKSVAFGATLVTP